MLLLWREESEREQYEARLERMHEDEENGLS